MLQFFIKEENEIIKYTIPVQNKLALLRRIQINYEFI
jgi:hypothetical protein